MNEQIPTCRECGKSYVYIVRGVWQKICGVCAGVDRDMD